MTKVIYKVNNNKLQQFKAQSLILNQHEYYLNQLANPNNRLYDLYVNNTLIGSTIYSLNKNNIYIYVISIFKEYRNNGYASQVIEFLKKFNKPINLTIDSANKQNIKFWTKRGFDYCFSFKINSTDTDLFYNYKPINVINK